VGGRRVVEGVRTKSADDDLVTTEVDPPDRGPAVPTGFDEFFRQEWAGAYRLAGFLTQDRTAAEEIAQDAFAQMYATWGRADTPAAYLRTAIVNRCSNWRRHLRVHRAKLPLLVTPASAEPVFDDLADAVAALPFRQRAVVVLRYHAGLTEAEIADALGCRPGTVKSLASRALTRLEREITR
jgi:RNA polymerase sigma-70 factor (sigma-E family)